MADTPDSNEFSALPLPTGTVAYPDREAARRAIEGDAGRAVNHFFRDATQKSIEFAIVFLTDGYHLSYFSPARTPGYGKRYHQIIDSEGQVLREYKETWGPSGLVEIKWLHGAPDDD